MQQEQSRWVFQKQPNSYFRRSKWYRKIFRLLLIICRVTVNQKFHDIDDSLKHPLFWSCSNKIRYLEITWAKENYKEDTWKLYQNAEGLYLLEEGERGRSWIELFWFRRRILQISIWRNAIPVWMCFNYPLVSADHSIDRSAVSLILCFFLLWSPSTWEGVKRAVVWIVWWTRRIKLVFSRLNYRQLRFTGHNEKFRSESDVNCVRKTGKLLSFLQQRFTETMSIRPERPAAFQRKCGWGQMLFRQRWVLGIFQHEISRTFHQRV